MFHKAETFILHNLPAVASASEDYKRLAFDDLTKLLDDTRLRVCCEEQLYEAVMLWVNYDVEKRWEKVPSLLRRIRLAYLPLEYFKKHVLTNSLVAHRADCASLLSEARQFIEVFARGGGQLLDLRKGLAKPRIPREVS